jgi:predicted RNA-binding protein YlxR (DUF448 family)
VPKGQKVKKVPLRICVGCQEVKPKKELIRVVRSPEGELLVDPTGKKAGRGAYICPSVECLEKALKGKQLERSLKVAIPPELADSLRTAIQTLPGGALTKVGQKRGGGNGRPS